MKRWDCELGAEHPSGVSYLIEGHAHRLITFDAQVEAGSKLEAEVAAIKYADTQFPNEAPWRCVRSRVESCWSCPRDGIHPGVVRKMAGDLRVLFCDDHQRDSAGFTSTVHTFDLGAQP